MINGQINESHAAINNLPSHSSPPRLGHQKLPNFAMFQEAAGWVQWLIIDSHYHHPILFHKMVKSHLVGGWPTPLKNHGVRQLGWCYIFPIIIWKVINMFQSPPTSHSQFSHSWSHMITQLNHPQLAKAMPKAMPPRHTAAHQADHFHHHQVADGNLQQEDVPHQRWGLGFVENTMGIPWIGIPVTR